MEENKRGDYPTGSSGGGGKKGYGVKHQFETGAPSTSKGTNEKRNKKRNATKTNVAINSILKLTDESGNNDYSSNSGHVPARGNSRDATVNNFDQERRHQYYNDENRYRIEEVELDIDNDGDIDFDKIFGSNNRNERSEGQREFADIRHANNLNGGGLGGGQDAGYIGGQGGARQIQRQEPLQQYIINVEYIRLHNYIVKTCQAYRSQSMELTNLMSLRDSHVLDIFNFNISYTDMLRCRTCDVPQLVEPLTYHIQCIRALMERRLLDAVAYQRGVTVIMSNLVGQYCARGELWATQVTFLTLYEFKLLWEKAKDAYEHPPYAHGPFAPGHFASSHFAPGYFARGQFAPGYFATGHFAPGQFAPGQFAPGHFAPGYFAPGHFAPGHFDPGHFDPGYFAPGHFAPGYFAPGHFARGHFVPGHFAPGHFAPGLFAPGHFAPRHFFGHGQVAPGQFFPSPFAPDSSVRRPSVPGPSIEVNWIAEYVNYVDFEGHRYRMVGEYRSRSFFNQ